MTREQLLSKVKQCIKADKALMEKLIDKAINSGRMDIEGAENNFLLPKSLLSAIYKEMSRQYLPFDKQGQKDTNNIGLHI